MSCSVPVCLAARSGDEGNAGLFGCLSSPEAPGIKQKAPRLSRVEMKQSTPPVHLRCRPLHLTLVQELHGPTRPFLHQTPDMQSCWSSTVKHRIAIKLCITLPLLQEHRM